jgi:cytochrome c oxidase subunit II
VRSHLANASCTVFVLICSGCAGKQSALDPAGVQASQIGALWWWFFAVCAGVYAVAMLFMVLPLFGRRTADAPVQTDSPVLSPDARKQRRLTMIVSGAVLLTVLILFALAISDFRTQRALGALRSDPHALKIKITGHQWWWKVEYPDPIPSNMVTTANELHIPVGRTVSIELLSSDVIHSFWVPNLHGKKDLVTGHPANITLRADRAGTFHGQCAEFCGLQHAKMKLTVVAESPAQFASWLKSQQQPAAVPLTEAQQRGYALFMSLTCVLCHNISGTPANGMTAPDLSHVASRPRIAGASVENTASNLVQWIVDPQHFKPGVRMPQHNLAANDLHALVEYLEHLR